MYAAVYVGFFRVREPCTLLSPSSLSLGIVRMCVCVCLGVLNMSPSNSTTTSGPPPRSTCLHAIQIIEAQSLEMKKLTAVITEAELERDRQRKEFASVLSERDVLRTQLMKRDAELSALYEKLKIQRSKLDLGRSTFEAQKKVEAELKAQIADLKSELQLSKLQVCVVLCLAHGWVG